MDFVECHDEEEGGVRGNPGEVIGVIFEMQ
jgi:hypothetical protein